MFERPFALFAAFALSTAAVPIPAAEWAPAAPMPTARQEIYAAAAGEHVYVPGGILRDGGFTAAFERYDAGTDAWVSLAPLPHARHHVTPAVAGGKVYAIGGFSGAYPDWVMHGDVFVYDPERDAWSAGPPMPHPQAEHVVAVIGSRIHVIGGRVPGSAGADHFFEHVDTPAHQVLDVATGTWGTAHPAPTARNSAAAAVVDGRIYVAGGRQVVTLPNGNRIQRNVPDLEVYDPATDTWESRAPMPQAQGGLAAAALDGRLYVFGGEQWTPKQKVFGNAWVYDPNTDRWHGLPPLPTPRHGLAAAAAAGRIFVIGGATTAGGGGAVGIVEALRP